MVCAGNAAVSRLALARAARIPRNSLWVQLGRLFNALLANFAYWFVWIFWFVMWSDRRWRRKRAARIDA